MHVDNSFSIVYYCEAFFNTPKLKCSTKCTRMKSRNYYPVIKSAFNHGDYRSNHGNYRSTGGGEAFILLGGDRVTWVTTSRVETV